MTLVGVVVGDMEEMVGLVNPNPNWDGLMEGRVVGDANGLEVGAKVGKYVGESEVGDTDGRVVGDTDRLLVGATVVGVIAGGLETDGTIL